MTRTLRRSAFAVLSTLALVSVVALAQAQQTTKPSGDPLNRAKEVTALIEQGQLDLRAAVELAEKHAKGRALEARCEIESGPSGDVERSGGAPTHPGAKPEKRVVFQITCFAKDRLQVIHVDAGTRQVLEQK